MSLLSQVPSRQGRFAFQILRCTPLIAAVQALAPILPDRGEALGRSSEDLLELTAKVGVVAELKLSGCLFAGVSFQNQFLGQSALQLPQPAPRRRMQLLFECPLQLALGNQADRRHLARFKIRPPGHLFPFLGRWMRSSHILPLPQALTKDFDSRGCGDVGQPGRTLCIQYTDIITDHALSISNLARESSRRC